MLNSISWQQYVTAVLLICAAWYVYIGLRYYRPELAARLKIKTPQKSTLPAVASVPAAVMGKVALETDTGIFDANELIFSDAGPDDISDQTLPKGPSDDLLAEAQTLVDAYSENDDKPEFLSLLHILIDKYEVYRDEIDLPSVIRSLHEFAVPRLPFPLKETELPLTF